MMKWYNSNIIYTNINFSKTLINSLDEEVVPFNTNIVSTREAVMGLLKFPERNKILIRHFENLEREKSNERGKFTVHSLKKMLFSTHQRIWFLNVVQSGPHNYE